MNALKIHLHRMQDDAAAVEALSRAIRAMSVRDEAFAHKLMGDMAEMAISLSAGLNNGLDIVNLPKGTLA